MLVTLQKNRIPLTLVASAVFLLFVMMPAFAQQDLGFDQAANIGEGAFGTTDLRDVIVNVVNIALGFLGIIATILLIYGGYLWMTSGGNLEQVDRAKKTILNTGVGLLVIISSWAIILFFTNQFSFGTGAGGPPSGSGGGIGNGALGAGIIEAIYPAPGAQNIPRNTSIFVRFKEPIDPNTLIVGGGLSGNLAFTGSATNPLDTHVQIENLDDITQTFASADVTVRRNAAGTDYTFTPNFLLGSPSVHQRFVVRLMYDIKKADGTDAFVPLAGNIGFQWFFTVSNVIDTTPPKLSSYLPYPLSTNPRNVVISMRFNEVINPLSVDGTSIVVNGGGGPISGTVFLAGDYRTVEFLPDAQCDNQPLNTCGEPVFCLPGNITVDTHVIADDTGTPVVDGIQDAAQNSFDGNGDGNASGPSTSDFNLGTKIGTGDNAYWEFDTNNTIDLIPPRVLERDPDTGGFAPLLNQTLMSRFDKQLSISTLRPGNTYGDNRDYVLFIDPRQEVGYGVTGTNGNGCSFQCLNEGSPSVFGSTCGNGTREQGEDCDDGNARSGDGCSGICLNEGTGFCGDGRISHGESCDDGNTNSNDGCSSVCKLEGTSACSSILDNNCCGNGLLDVGEECDDTTDTACNAGANANPINCLLSGNNAPTGVGAFCGNGGIERSKGEACDDGNTQSGDGCSSLCILEGAFCGINGNTADGLPGLLDIGEDCDDGNNAAGDGCSPTCQHEGTPIGVCGNGTNTPPVGTPGVGEDCDLGPILNESYVFIDTTGMGENLQYGIRIGAGVRDLYQNCFLPSAESPASTYSNCLMIPGATSFGWVEAGGPNSWPPAATFPNCQLN